MKHFCHIFFYHLAANEHFENYLFVIKSSWKLQKHTRTDIRGIIDERGLEISHDKNAIGWVLEILKALSQLEGTIFQLFLHSIYFDEEAIVKNIVYNLRSLSKLFHTRSEIAALASGLCRISELI